MHTLPVLRSGRRACAALFLFAAARALFAVSATESQLGDFPGSAGAVGPGFTFAMAAGANTFSGTVPFASDDTDFFKITVPAGVIVTDIQTTSGNGFTLPGPFPLTPGTYTIAAGTGFTLNDNNWALTVTAANVDYAVSTTGGKIVVTELGTRAETLSVTQPTSTTIRFSAAGRVFSVNGGAGIDGNSGDISLSSVTALEITFGAGGDTLDFGEFKSGEVPGTTITTAAGGESSVVNFLGYCYFKGVGLRVASTGPVPDRITVAPGARLFTGSGGDIVLAAGRSVVVGAGATVQATYDDVSISANTAQVARSGSFNGITISGLVLAGERLSLNGRGGDDPGGFQLGINIVDGGRVLGGSSPMEIIGIGGGSTGIVNRGITVYGTGSTIQFGNAGGIIDATAGSIGSGYGIGLSVLYGGKIFNGAFGRVTINGRGAGADGSGFNQGIEVGAADSRITSNGPVDLTAAAGPGASTGLYVSTGANVALTSTSAQSIVRLDGLFIDTQSSVTLSSGAGSTVLSGRNDAPINLGGDGSTGPFALDAATLARISSTNLVLGGTQPSMVISQPVVVPGNLTLKTATGGTISPEAVGTDIDLGSGLLTVASNLNISIFGTTPDTQHSRLKVVGGVAIGASASLVLNVDTAMVSALGDTFTIIDNDGTDPISGTFVGVPEGTTAPWPTDLRFHVRISYQGGTGNDVTVTLVEHPPIVVLNANDSGAGSLRDAIDAAIAAPGDDRIVFDPSLAGQIITLNLPLSLSDKTYNVTIDASALGGGLLVTRAPHTFSIGEIADVSGRARFVDVSFYGSGGSQSIGGALNVTGYAEFEGCTFAANNALVGGAIYSSGTLQILRCSFYGNTALRGGAIYQSGGGPVSLDRCTLHGNNANVEGGAIFLQAGANATLVHCTVTGNTTTDQGSAGGIYVTASALTLSNSIVATDQFSGIDLVLDGASTLTHQGINIIRLLHTNPAATISGGSWIIDLPRLGGLGYYGGSTLTVPTLVGSPARNAATPDTTTADQRGVAYVGTPDIGAYEAGAFTDFLGWRPETFPAAHVAGDGYDFADYDADGAPDLLEYALLTDPLQSRATDALPRVTRTPAGLVIEFATRKAADLATIDLERSTDLATWTVVASVNGATGVATITSASLTSTTPSAPGLHAFIATAAADAPRAFYRLKAVTTGAP